VKAVVLVNGTRVEISGKTQEIEVLKAEMPLFEQIFRRELKEPPKIADYRPDPNTGLAFMAILDEMERTTNRKIELLEEEGIDKIPSVEGVIY